MGPVEAAFGDYLILAKELNRLIKAKERVPDSLTRETAKAVVRVADAYCRPGNWPEWDGDSLGRPTEPFPLTLARTMRVNVASLLGGHKPTWMRALERRGAPRGHPEMNREKAIAVAYRKAAASGLVRDKSPAKTIATAFGVERQGVQKWVREQPDATPDLFGWRTEEEARTALAKAAHSYSEWGRAPRIRRPHGKR
jgi:hypothetical protein